MHQEDQFLIHSTMTTGKVAMSFAGSWSAAEFKKANIQFDYMTQWFAEAPTHHCAMSIGHNASLFRKAVTIGDQGFLAHAKRYRRFDFIMDFMWGLS
ncbi:hypothetical protein [Cohnella yongneupensis]|uniref:Uncharacterized protein n=1 Tax=Cohnella yongneupensis TaxID=425006 RepID=A0ABW0R583_9BACL